LVEIFLRFLTERQAAVAAHGDDGGGPLLPLSIGDHVRLTVLKVGDHRVAGAEVDADVGHLSIRPRGEDQSTLSKYTPAGRFARVFSMCDFGKKSANATCGHVQPLVPRRSLG